MMRVIALALAVGLAGCSTVHEWTGADWMTAEWWDFSEYARQPLPAGGKAVKLEDGKEAAAKPKASKGERTLRMTGQTAKDAKDAAFKGAQDTCKDDEEDSGLVAEVVKDKAGHVSGSFFHDVEFNCVKGEE